MRRKKRKSGKIIFGILIIAALAVSAFASYEYFLKPKSDDQPADDVVTPTVLNPETRTPTDAGKGSDDPEVITGKEPVIQYDGDDPNKASDLTGAITYAGATANSIIIRVNIDQYVDGGTCVLKILSGGSVVYQTSANLIADVSTSTCDGFNLPRSVVGSGDFALSIELSSGGKTGVINGGVSL